METDPVCGVAVDRMDAFQEEYGGDVYFFCSRVCLESFERQPERFAGVAQTEKA